jgi:hypothetical protein
MRTISTRIHKKEVITITYLGKLVQVLKDFIIEY